MLRGKNELYEGRVKVDFHTFEDGVFCHPNAATVGSTPVIIKGKKYKANSMFQVLKGAEFVKP